MRAVSSPTDTGTALRWREAEMSNLLALVRVAFEQGHDEIAWRLPATLFGYFTVAKPWAAWIGMHRVGPAAASLLGDLEGTAEMHNNLAVALGLTNRPDLAIEHLRHALATNTTRGAD